MQKRTKKGAIVFACQHNLGFKESFKTLQKQGGSILNVTNKKENQELKGDNSRV